MSVVSAPVATASSHVTRTGYGRFRGGILPRGELDALRVPNLTPDCVSSLAITGAQALRKLAPDFPIPGNITPHPQFIRADLADYLKVPFLSGAQMARLAKPLYPHGILLLGEAIPASLCDTHLEPTKSYFTHAWIRDSVFAIYGLAVQGQHAEASRAFTGILRTISRPEWREVFAGYHFSQTAHDDFLKRTLGWPQIRMGISPAGKLEPDLVDSQGHKLEDGKAWAHDQLGSWGQFMWLAYELHRMGVVNLPEVERSITVEFARSDDARQRATAAFLSQESIFATIAVFLSRVSTVYDSAGVGRISLTSAGPWEEERVTNRTSELGPILGGIRALLRQQQLVTYHHQPEQREAFWHEMHSFERRLTEVINEQVPDQMLGVAIESKHLQGLDAAVTILFGLPILELTTYQVLSLVRPCLRLMHADDPRAVLSQPGIIRYPNDRYLARGAHRADHDYNVPHELVKSEAMAEALWTIFDPGIAHGLFAKANQLLQQENSDEVRDGIALSLLANPFLKRSLMSSLPHTSEFNFKSSDGRSFSVKHPAYGPVEALYTDDTGLSYHTNPNSLQWLIAQRAIMQREGYINSLRIRSEGRKMRWHIS